MSDPRPDLNGCPGEDEDPALARLERDRKPGELESGMLTGTDDGEISATERFEGELSPEEALQALDPGHAGGGMPVR